VTTLFIVLPLGTEDDTEKANFSFKSGHLENICNLKELLWQCWVALGLPNPRIIVSVWF